LKEAVYEAGKAKKVLIGTSILAALGLSPTVFAQSAPSI